MFVVAEAIDLTTPLIQSLPTIIKMTWPFIALALAVVFLRDVLPHAISGAIEKRKQSKWFEAQNTIADIQGVTPKEFERFVAMLFGKLGFSAKTTNYTKDGGVDVIAVKNGENHFIQCKKFITSKVTLSQVRDFYGAMANAGCRRGFFVTTGFFTLDAEQFAAGKPIELINGERLMEYLKKTKIDLKNVPQAKAPAPTVSTPTQRGTEKSCPKCGSPLIIRRAKKGTNAGSEFWGCSPFRSADLAKHSNNQKWLIKRPRERQLLIGI